MAGGGIIAFRHGGSVKKFADGGELSADSGGDVSDAPSPLGRWWEKHKAENRALTAAHGDEEPESYGYAPSQAKTGPIKQGPPALDTPQVKPPPVELAQLFNAPNDPGGALSLRTGTAHGVNVPLNEVHEPAYHAAEWNKYLGPNTDLDEARQQLADMKKGRKDQAGNSVNMAMIRAGLGMMASKRPDTLGMAGEGGIGGLEQYTAERNALNKDQAEELQRQVQLGQISRQEAEGKLKYATQESRAEEQTRRALQVDNAKSNMEAQKLNMMGSIYKPAAQQIAEARFYGLQNYKKAVAAYNKDPLNNPKPGNPEDYIGEATGKLSERAGIAGLTTASKEAIARVNIAQKQLANESDPKMQAILQQVINSNGAFDPNAVGTVRRR